MTAQKAVFIGCGIVAGLCALLFGLFAVWLNYISEDPEGMAITVDAPHDVKVGESYTVIVNVKNERATAPLKVTDVDIANQYIAGSVISSVEPVPESSTSIPLAECLSHTFNQTIAPGETVVFKFTRRAASPGIYRGDIDVCEGNRFMTKVAQTIIKE